MIAVGTFCTEIWSKSRIQLNSIHLSKSLVHLIQSTEWALFQEASEVSPVFRSQFLLKMSMSLWCVWEECK